MRYSLETIIYFEKSCSVALLFFNVTLTRVIHSWKARGSHLPLNHVGSHLPLNEVRWSGFRGECDPCFCVADAIVSEPQKDFFHPRESYSRVMRRSNSHFNQLPGHYGCYGVPLLRCNIHFEQLRRCFGCYVPTAISINFQHAMDATL